MRDILLDQGHDVYIIDNASTYAPLREWYDSLPKSRVILLSENLGARAPWDYLCLDRVEKDYYAVTDPDLDISGVPADWPEKLKAGAWHYGEKCGLGLNLTGVPSRNPAWLFDSFCFHPDGDHPSGGQRDDDLVGGLHFHLAPADTTFAVYPPKRKFRIEGVRAPSPYVARHLPWHVVPEPYDEPRSYQLPLTDEYLYYMEHAGPASTTAQRFAAAGYLKRRYDAHLNL